TCLLFGLLPALRASRADAALVLKSHGTAGHERLGVRRVLVVTQLGLSFVLLVGALLFARSFRNLITERPGFDDQGVVEMVVDLPPLQLEPARRDAMHAEVLARLRATPLIQAAASTSIVPISGNGWNDPVWLDGVEPQKQVDCN